MKQLQSMISDGAGNTSIMRVITLLTALSVLVPKIINSFKLGTPLVWDTSDMEMIGVVLGAKLVQNHQENTESKTNEKPTVTPAI